MSDEFVIIDTAEVVKELKKLERRGMNLTDVNMQLAQILHVMVDDKFQDEGPGWKGFAESTLRRRRASKSPKLLQDTGDLINSLMPASGADFAEVFTNKAYAKFHINGDGVAQRDFFDIDTEKALAMFDEILSAEIARGR